MFSARIVAGCARKAGQPPDVDVRVVIMAAAEYERPPAEGAAVGGRVSPG